MRGALLLPLFLAACGGKTVALSHPDLDAEAIREVTVDVSGAAHRTLDLATPAGDIRVEVTDGPPQVVARMRLMARSEFEAEDLLERFTVEGRAVADAFLVRTEGEPVAIAGTKLRVEPLVSFLARIPPGQNLRAETGSGRVEVKGAAGECSAETSFGDVKLVGVRGGAVQARTGSGHVELADVQAERIEVETSFGDVRLENVRGNVEVRAGSGDLVLADFAEGGCELKTGFGNIDAQGSFVSLSAKTSSGRVGVMAEAGSRIQRPWMLHSSFGDVELRVPKEFDCDLYAETSFGSVTSSVDVRREGRPSDQRVRGEIGDGGGRVTLRTSSGDIRIRLLP
jgi:DUF4097 and DUF4098 domain-containing protein YvlB